MKNQRALSVVLPVYNEDKNIEQTVKDSAQYLKHQKFFDDYEVIVVDDGSRDRTAGVLKELSQDVERLKVVTHAKNLGYGRALVSGIKEAQFSWVLLMDSDGQFKMNSITDIEHCFSEYDIITGYRSKRADTAYRELLGKIYTSLAGRIFGLKLKDINCGFKLFKKDTLHLNGRNFHAGIFYTNIFIKARNRGYKIKEFPVEHFPRRQGRQTGANFNVVFRAVVDLLRLIVRRK